MIQHVTQEFLDSIKLPTPHGKKLKYLLVMPQIATNDNIMYLMPYGFCLVAAALKASGREVFTLNLNYKEDPYELVKRVVVENNIDVLATGGLSGQFSQLKKILDAGKEANPNLITMVGGGIITADPVVAMKAFENADYGMIGEGEITINELAYALENGTDVRNVAGVVLPDGYVTEPRNEITNLDMLPFPDYEGLELDVLLEGNRAPQSWYAPNSVGITLSRSCPFDCTFCFHSSGKKYRRRSLDNVFQEIDWVIKTWGADRQLSFVINDELFISSKAYLQEFCLRIKEYGVQYWAQTRVDTTTKDALIQLKESGCIAISYGVESADDNILKSMRKKITVAQIERAFDMAIEVGLPAYGNIIFGDLEETQTSIQNCLKWWKEHLHYNIFLIYILTFPGTHLYKVACEKGIIKDPVKYLVENDTQINVTSMPDEEYWETVRKIELFQMLTLAGIDVDVNLSNVTDRTKILQHNLEQIAQKGKVAVWPTLFSTIDLLNTIAPNFIESENVFFVNSAPNDTRLQGIEQFGKFVHTPDVVEKENIETILFAFTQPGSAERVFSRVCAMIHDQYPMVKKIIRLSELLE